MIDPSRADASVCSPDHGATCVGGQPHPMQTAVAGIARPARSGRPPADRRGDPPSDWAAVPARDSGLAATDQDRFADGPQDRVRPWVDAQRLEPGPEGAHRLPPHRGEEEAEKVSASVSPSSPLP